ncbi:RCC1 domain-containing protein [Nocardioides daejeonensis]|uniref:RCC1 domain-containing protein n=1 Tax=Nocardioides daejeonensis TaxID=1046556 RepID=UPI000D74AFE2|nr:Ig-like domain repeat protein [Nocardioides daejeonensis]
MSTKPLIRSIAAAGVLALTAGLLGGIAHAAPDPVDAGQVVSWGQTGADPISLPTELGSTAIADVAVFADQAVFLTATGEVIMREVYDDNPADEVPEELAGEKVISIAASSAYAALTESGKLIFWGNVASPSTDVGSTPVNELTQIALGQHHGVGLKADGTVVAWGANADGQTDVPGDLDDVVKVVAGDEHSYALRADGTVVGWGRNQFQQVTMPAAVGEPGSVVDIAARGAGGLALMSDGSLVSWGQQATVGFGAKYNLPPASLADKNVTRIAASNTGANLAIDDTGAITTWGSTRPDDVPADLDGGTIAEVAVSSQLAVAIQPAVMPITNSTVSGTAKQGQTLTGTPATFSGTPDGVSTEWLADGTSVAEGTTLVLTAAHVGKKITFRTTASTPEGDVVSDSTPTAAVAALISASKTAINKVKVKKSKATIKLKVTSSTGTPTGKVKVEVKKGKKKVFSKNVKLKNGGAKVVLKKLKKGKYKITAKYAGSKAHKASNAKGKFRVK